MVHRSLTDFRFLLTMEQPDNNIVFIVFSGRGFFLGSWHLAEHVSGVWLSGAKNLAERAENRVERSVERAWQKTMERERSAEREIAERERSLSSTVYFFTVYTTPLSTLISSLSLNHHLYADDTQLSFFLSIGFWLQHHSVSAFSPIDIFLDDC